MNLEELEDEDLQRIRKHHGDPAKSARDSVDTMERDAQDLPNDDEENAAGGNAAV